MTIHKFRRDNNFGRFGVIPSDTVFMLRNTDAHAIWSYLMHKPEDWVPRETEIREFFENLSKERYRKAKRYLIDMGLITVDRSRNQKGQLISTTTTVHSTPNPDFLSNRPIAQPIRQESRTVARPTLPSSTGKGPDRTENQPIRQENRTSGKPDVRFPDPLLNTEESLQNTEKTHSHAHTHTREDKPPKTEAKPRPKPTSKPKAPPLNFNLWPQRPAPDQWEEILAIRKTKKARTSQRAVDQLGKQLTKAVAAGYPFQQCMDTWEARQWSGFNVDWMNNAQGNGRQQQAPQQRPRKMLRDADY